VDVGWTGIPLSKERNKEEESRKSVGQSPGNWRREMNSRATYPTLSLVLLPFFLFKRKRERKREVETGG